MSADLQRIDPNQEKTWQEIQKDINREMLLRHFVSEAYAECIKRQVEAELIKAEEKRVEAKGALAKARLNRVGKFFGGGDLWLCLLGMVGVLAVAATVGMIAVGGALVFKLIQLVVR